MNKIDIQWPVKMLVAFLMVGVQFLTAAELAQKYQFATIKKPIYVTSVVKSSNYASKFETAIIEPQVQNFRKLQPNVQVVAAKNDVSKHPVVATIIHDFDSQTIQPNVQIVAVRNFADQQPLTPTISYSYKKPKVMLEVEPIVIASRDYFDRRVRLTSAALNRDYVDLFIVGETQQKMGFNKEPKINLQKVELKISQNTLIGCAPLSITCSRTASDRAKLKIERGPIEQVSPEPAVQQRQQLTP